jgi:hypothetical protein
MGSTKFKHNKKRNSGLIYEFLVRKMTESLIERDSKSYKQSLGIIKKYFSKGQPLDRERQLFEAITRTRGIKKSVGAGIIQEVITVARKLDHRVINIKKSNVIKDIHRTFGRGLFSSYRLQEYKAFASIQMLINSCNPKATINESVQRVQLADALINYMSTVPVADVEKVNSDPLVYKIAMQKFNDRYDDSLNESQKRLLKCYAKALASPPSKSERAVRTLLRNEQKRLILDISAESGIKEIIEDKNMSKKLKEAKAMLHEMDLSKSLDKRVEDLLLYCSLVEELKSNG